MGRTWYLEGNRKKAGEAWRKGMETNRFNLWGERCAKALARLEKGEPIDFD
jgi:hypothetical protein